MILNMDKTKIRTKQFYFKSSLSWYYAWPICHNKTYVFANASIVKRSCSWIMISAGKRPVCSSLSIRKAICSVVSIQSDRFVDTLLWVVVINALKPSMTMFSSESSNVLDFKTCPTSWEYVSSAGSKDITCIYFYFRSTVSQFISSPCFKCVLAYQNSL